MRRRRLFPKGNEHGLLSEPVRTQPNNRYVYANVTRVTSCNVEVIEAFCRKVAKGVPASTACDSLAIMGDTFHEWIALGENWLRGEGDREEEVGRLCAGFVVGIKTAGAHWVEERLKVLQQEGNREWKRDMHLLEVRDPRNFSAAAEGGNMESYDPDENFV